MTNLTPDFTRHEIGRGRSGIVYVQYGSDGRKLACKVFDSRGLTKVVQLLTLGAPNPYVWNSDAVQCAKLRRNILKRLVPVWTSGKVDVADAVAAIRNEEHKTFELQTQLISGWAAHLHHPLSDRFDGEAENLWKNVMPDLRAHLQDAGFDGLLWQAGEGNPVALNNFLFEPNHPSQPDALSDEKTQPSGRWVWIDLESGVPAIFPISLKVLFNYSLRHWKRLGRPMFDDVNTRRLNEYLDAEADKLARALGEPEYQAVLAEAQRLEQHQEQWKSVGRLQSSIRYRLSRGEIDQAQAEYFARNRLLWSLKEMRRGITSSAVALNRGVTAGVSRIKSVDVTGGIRATWKFLVSQTYREEFIHAFLRKSIEKWTQRGQLSRADADRLQQQIGAPDASVFITDFGIHLAIKPAVKIFQFWLLPALFALGILSGTTLALLIATGGALARSAYTFGRLVQSTVRGSEKPFVALAVGVLPVVGNLAYPAQMAYSSGGKDEKLAQFMVFDGFARVGRHLPIWGGEDTWTEHFLNRFPRTIGRFLRSKRLFNGDGNAKSSQALSLENV